MKFLLLSLLGLSLHAADNQPPEPERRLARDIFKHLIEFNTSFTTGKTTPAAEWVAQRMKAEGFTDVKVLGAAPHKANVIIRYKGTGQQKPLLLLAHLDVVEARREDWTMDPFVLNEKDGFFWGRGTGDDKAQASLWLANLIRMKREGWRPSRDIIVALTADEEGGGPYNGVAWLLKHHRPLIDAEYCLNEGGWGEMSKGRRLINTIQFGEKTFANFRIEVKNPGGHSSMPVRENAIYRLARALERISEFEFPAHLNDLTRGYFERMATQYQGQQAHDLAQTAAGNSQAIARVAAASPAWNATLRTTCVATMLDGGHAFNALPQVAGANINCRVIPEESPESILQTLRKVVSDPNVEIRFHPEPPIAGPTSASRPDVLAATRAVTQEMWPGVPVVPIMVMGGTDGKYLRAEGIPTYGVMGLFFERDDIRFHGQNERIGVNEYYECQTFLYRLVRELAK